MATLAELQADLVMYREAERAIVLGAQAYEVAGRKVTKANLAEIRAAKAELEQRIALLSGPTHGNVVFGARR